jgi:hypothetical protein
MTKDELYDTLEANGFMAGSKLVVISENENGYVLTAKTPRTKEVLEFLFENDPDVEIM